MEPYAPEPQPQQPRGTSRLTKIAAAVGEAAGLAIGATALAGAVTSPSVHPAAQATDPTPPADNPPPAGQKPFGPDHRKPGGPGFGGPGKMDMGMGIHGEFVVPGRDGGYQTIATQHGEVTAVSPTSITVKSEDGYEKAYDVSDATVVTAGDNGIDDVKVGDKVMVLATVADGKYQARQVHDGTAVGSRHDQWAPQPKARPGAGPKGATPGGTNGANGTGGTTS
jgi:hypothetical protein